MCGILGTVNIPVDAPLRLLSRLSHRGPDTQGFEHIIEPCLLLGHTRLAIIDLSPTGAQPMWDRARRSCIVFNGEIFNHLELRHDLQAKGYVFSGHSDTEALLYGYLEYGAAVLGRLNGIFAFAIWDTRCRRLLVARDGLGVKPLYYYARNGQCAFASELKALLELPPLSRELNSEALSYYLQFLWCPAPHTPFRDICKLEPGHAFYVIDGCITQQWRFYDIPLQTTKRSLSDQEAIIAVRQAVQTAVHRQMIADVPVGAFLSGGLDSTAVVAFARQFAHGGRLPCFTIDIDANAALAEGMAPDLPYAKVAAAALEVDLHVVSALPSMVDLLPQVLYHLDEPQADPASINMLLITQLARSQGIKVLLSGTGGDDIFTGYRRHQALLLEKYWSWLPAWGRAQLAALAARLPASHPIARRFVRAFRYAGLNGHARIASYFNWLDPVLVRNLLSPALRHSMPVAMDPLKRALGCLFPHSEPMDKMLYLECKYFLADHNLNYTDKMGMAAGVETRVPLLDLDLIQLAFSLPTHLKQRGATSKWVFRQAMRGILPDNIIDRPKTGFGVPLRAWLKGPLSVLLNDNLSESAIKQRGLFDAQAVAALRLADKRGYLDASYPIFALLCIELWCQSFVDRA